MLGEPSRTAYDLHFNLGPYPVRIHPLFWLVSILLNISAPPIVVAIWTIVVLFSLIVHEMGHAIAFRIYGRESHIVLYSFGGVTVPDSVIVPRRQTPFSRIMISLAGPLAGFLFAGLLVLGLHLTGYRIALEFPFFPWISGTGEFIRNLNLNRVIYYLLEVNIFWGLVNLLPIYPLDGGQIVRELLQWANPLKGLEQALKLSVVAAIGVAILAFTRFHEQYVAMMFAYLAYTNYTLVQSYSRGGY